MGRRLLSGGLVPRAPLALRALALLAVAAPVLIGACEDPSHEDIGDEINILVRRDDQLVPPATERLAAYKRRAIPQIETALHTAAPTGRMHLVAALERIGDTEASPVLRQVALYDVTPDVRQAASAVLARWASGAGDGARRAHAALAEIARRRAAGEGPLLFGDGGVPGAPSTVGAPEAVGAPPRK